MPSTITYKRGQVIVVNVPFSNHSGIKPRPALIVSSEGFHRDLPDLIVCPISSERRYYRRPGTGDHPIREWRAVGFHYPSTARISKLLAVDKKIIKTTLGALSPEDLARIEAGLREALALR